MRKRSEYTNSEVRGFLMNFFDVAQKPRLKFTDILATNEDDGFKLYSSELEVDEKGYINKYNLLTSEKRYIGIRITDTSWVCTFKEINIEDAKYIALFNLKETIDEMQSIDIDKRQITLFP
jgi:DNA polymerase elongation subunit (family B)